MEFGGKVGAVTTRGLATGDLPPIEVGDHVGIVAIGTANTAHRRPPVRILDVSARRDPGFMLERTGTARKSEEGLQVV
jgi:hypothetical protein